MPSNQYSTFRLYEFACLHTSYNGECFQSSPMLYHGAALRLKKRKEKKNDVFIYQAKSSHREHYPKVVL